MIEDVINQLDDMGVEYTENYEEGVVTVDIANVDKIALIDIISVINDSGLLFNIDESMITIITEDADPMAEEPMEEAPAEDMQAIALDDMVGM
mgnify:CR=1 FL=1